MYLSIYLSTYLSMYLYMYVKQDIILSFLLIKNVKLIKRTLLFFTAKLVVSYYKK
jgi:hypothetical protein